MWRTVVRGGDEAEREQILECTCRYGRGRQQPVRADGCADWQGLIGQLKEGEPDVVIVTQNDAAGVDITASAHLSPRRCIWLSNLDFVIQAYRLCLGWFDTRPVAYDKVEQALSRCMGDETKTGNTWE